MKKLFTLAFAFALIVGCAKEEKVSIGSPEAVNTGDAISFTVNDEATKAEWREVGTKWSTIWYSEVDNLGVVFADAAWNDKGANTKVQPELDLSTATTWGGTSAFGGGDAKELNAGAQAYTNPWGWATTAAWTLGTPINMAKMVFKATRNEANGVFTAANNDNRLYFPKTKRGDPAVLVNPSFLVFYPSSLNPQFDATATDPATADAEIEITVNAGVLSSQSQSTIDGSDSWAMTDGLVLCEDPTMNMGKANDAKERAANSSITMKLERQYAVFYFQTQNHDADLLGGLLGITLTAPTAKVISYSSAPTVLISERVQNTDGTFEEYTKTGGTASHTVALNLTGDFSTGWKDGNKAYMAVNPFVWNVNSEDLTVTWIFANTTVTTPLKYSSAAQVSFDRNEFYEMPAFDVNKLDYYCVKLDGSLNYNGLVINSGCEKTLDQIIDATDNIIWDGSPAASNITTFICNKELDEDELSLAKAKLTTVTHYKLANEADDLGDNLENIVATTSIPVSLTLTKSVSAPTITAMSSLIRLQLDKATTIKDGAFTGNTVLQTVIIPEVTTIGASAFSGCIALTKVDARKATTLGYSAFAGCIKLTKIGNSNNFDPLSETASADNIYLDALKIIGEQAFSGINTTGGTGISSINLPNLTTIETKAFLNSESDATDGTTINAPELVGIAFDAFGLSVSPYNPYLGDIRELRLKKYDYSQETVRNQLVQRDHLKMIDLSAVNKIEKVVSGSSNFLNFDGYTHLEDVILKEGVEIGFKAFNGCAALNKIEIEKASFIGEEAFKGCESLTEVKIYLSAANKALGKYAFYGTDGLSSVEFGPNVESIGEAAFQTAGIAGGFDVVINRVKNIGKDAFSNSTVKGIDLTKVTTLGESAFKNCTQLEGVYDSERAKYVIYLGASSVPESAFEGCTKVDIYDLKAEEVTVGRKAFKDGNSQTIINFKHSSGNAIIHNFDFINLSWSTDAKTGAEEVSHSYIINFSGTLNGNTEKTNILPTNKIVINDPEVSENADYTFTLTGVYQK